MSRPTKDQVIATTLELIAETLIQDEGVKAGIREKYGIVGWTPPTAATGIQDKLSLDRLSEDEYNVLIGEIDRVIEEESRADQQGQRAASILGGLREIVVAAADIVL